MAAYCSSHFVLLPVLLRSLEAGALSRHPKFAALKDLLLSYTDQDSFHGIVFARTREAVRSLTSLIQASPELQFLEVSGGCHGSRCWVVPSWSVQALHP
jgi:hypothetical protein